MKVRILFLFAFIHLISPGVGAGTLSIDGPYVFHLSDNSMRIIAVDKGGSLSDTVYRTLPKDLTLPVWSHAGEYLFDVALHPVERPAWQYEQPEKVFVMSDPHGNLECFVSTLRMNGVIDKAYRWIFGRNHLMVIGDVFDRGDDVLPLLWLIYKLEQEAREAGGHVSFLLGNHEPMILAGDLRYMTEKYSRIAEHTGIPYERFFGADSELGRWLAVRNTIEVIGSDLFVHAGLSREFLEHSLSIPEVNEEMSRGIHLTKQERNKLSPLTGFLYGSYGPVWYRGMVRNDEKYAPLEPEVLNQLLTKYDVCRVIVGHTVFPDIRTFYGGRVIAVNVDNKKNFAKVLGRGILIKRNSTFVISDKGILRDIPSPTE